MKNLRMCALKSWPVPDIEKSDNMKQLKEQAEQWASFQQTTASWPTASNTTIVTTPNDSSKSLANSNVPNSSSAQVRSTEEEEFECQFKVWEKQFETWKQQNQNHPDKEAFAQYVKQWEEWRVQLFQRKEQMLKAKAQQSSAGLATSSTIADSTASSSIAAMYYQQYQSMYMQPYMYTGAVRGAVVPPAVVPPPPAADVPLAMVHPTGVLSVPMQQGMQMGYNAPVATPNSFGNEGMPGAPNNETMKNVTNSSDGSPVLSVVPPGSTPVNDDDIEADLQKEGSQQSISPSVISEDSSLDIAIEAIAKHSNIEDAIAKELNLDLYDMSNLPETEEGLIEELKTLASQGISLRHKIKATMGQIKKASFLLKKYRAKKNKVEAMICSLKKKKSYIYNLLKAFEENDKTSDMPKKKKNRGKKRKNAKSSEASACSSEKKVKEDDNSGCSQSVSRDVSSANTALCDVSDDVIVLPIPTNPDPPLIVLDEEATTAEVNNEVSKSVSRDVSNANTSLCDVSDEVLVLPIPTKPDPPLIILDEEADTAEVDSEVANLEDNEKSASDVSSFFKNQCCFVHSGSIIKIVVFDDFLYTCSSDGTAKRIDLKDFSSVVSYQLVKIDGLIKNIAVGKALNETVVCALTNKNLVVMLFASTGKRIATFSEASPVMALCKGWGKFYSGWSDGTIHIYSWTAEKEAIRKEILHPKQKIVKTYQPMCSIATTNEGYVPFLLVLTTEGKIILRSAETAVYIRSIETGKADSNILVDKRIVGIAFSEKYIFTIMANSNIVTCYNVDKICEEKMICEVEDCSDLTSIYVYENWVILGNKGGKIIAFKFDIQDSFSCKFGDCTRSFRSMNALRMHLKHVHLNSATRCEWLNCDAAYSCKKLKKKMLHMKKHVREIPFFSFG